MLWIGMLQYDYIKSCTILYGYRLYWTLSNNAFVNSSLYILF